MKLISLILVLSLCSIALGYDPSIDRFPQTPDFTNTSVWTQPILKWVYHHLNIIYISGYKSTGFTATSYGRLIAGGARAGVVFWDCVYDAYVAAKGRNWRTMSDVEYNIHPTLNNADTNKAMAFAAYTSLMYNFAFLGTDFVTYINNALTAAGYNPADASNNSTSTPNGIGVLACQNVLNNRYINDGTNFRGDHPLTDNPGVAHSDYSNWRTQPPMPTIGHTDCNTLQFIDQWQPARVRQGSGTFVITWSDHIVHLLKSVVMPCNNAFRPGPIYRNITATRPQWLLRNEILVNRSAVLGDFEKAIANYWQDGEGYGGTVWLRYAATAANKTGLGLRKTIKLNHLIAHAQMEGYIVQYEGKRFYNTPRPTSPIQCIYKNTPIKSWKGPYLGVGNINGSDWTAYFADTWVQNPNPEYPCGHCSHSGVVGAAFKAFFGGDDTFQGYTRTYLPGAYIQEPKVTNTLDPLYRAGLSDVANTGPESTGYAPANPVTLTWPTWTALTSQAALSRTYLGVHYDDSQQISYANGRALGEHAYDYIKTNYWNGDMSDD